VFCTAEDTEDVEKDNAKGMQSTSKAGAIQKFSAPELVGYKVICLSLSPSLEYSIAQQQSMCGINQSNRDERRYRLEGINKSAAKNK
jgi:hypothetical protein